MTASSYRDHLGRPIVAVTGMGIITSLGQGLSNSRSLRFSASSTISVSKLMSRSPPPAATIISIVP
ncbi:hypothetical protein ACC733_37910, partial [Rhizobium johnstonii]